MAWDAKSGEVLESFFSSWDVCRDCKPCGEIQPVNYIPSLDDYTKVKIDRLNSFDSLYDVLQSTDRTIEKFRDVIEESDPEYKIKILGEPCDICIQYDGDHENCLYEKRCKERFDDNEFHSPEEMDKFAREEIEFCESVKNYLFEKMDSIAEKDELVYQAYKSDMGAVDAVIHTGKSYDKIRGIWKKLGYSFPDQRFIPWGLRKQIVEDYEDGITPEETAEELDLELKTVKSILEKGGFELPS